MIGFVVVNRLDSVVTAPDGQQQRSIIDEALSGKRNYCDENMATTTYQTAVDH